jgi:hypothetical protein
MVYFVNGPIGGEAEKTLSGTDRKGFPSSGADPACGYLSETTRPISLERSSREKCS